MKRIRGINWFFAFIALTLGGTLIKHFDYKNFTFEDPALDILYLIIFIISIYFLIKDFIKHPEK